MMNIRTVLFLITLIIVFGCNPSQHGNGLTGPVTESPTLLISSSNTPNSTLIPSSTRRPTSTPNPTPIPTLSENGKETYLLELFAQNDDCVLPCLWGFEPSLSSFHDVNNVLGPFGLVSYGRRNFGILFDQPGYGALALGVWIEKDIVQNVGFRITIKNGLSNDNKVYKKYALNEILTQYGAPSRIFIGLRSTAIDPYEGNPIYEMWLFYDHLGILINYGGLYYFPKFDEKMILVCPSYEKLGFMVFYLQHRDAKAKLEALYDLNFESGTDHFYDGIRQGILKTWEQTTDLGIDTFFDMYVDPDNQACFESPIDRW